MPDDPKPIVTGAETSGTQTLAPRDAAADAATAETRRRDNTARAEDSRGRSPTPRELSRLRKERFGDGAGSILVDTDLATGETTLVYRDGEGKETREPYEPEVKPRAPA